MGSFHFLQVYLNIGLKKIKVKMNFVEVSLDLAEAGSKGAGPKPR
jgi:hypothetical protein